ncbi:MAG: aspartate kinase, partial [Candidatus Thorarchaeota archaeon]|nr:aspartate kinase [Candidatus Thorarchaeota archaeon]
MKIMKFGGGCLRDDESFLRVAELIKNERPGKIAIVVSAIYGITDKLESAIKIALHSEDLILELTNEIRQAHYSITENLVNNPQLQDMTLKSLEERLKKLDRLLYGVTYTSEVTETVRVLILSQGERLAAIVLAAVLQDRGIQSIPLESDAIGVQTDDVCDNATADLPASRRNLDRKVNPVLQQGIIPVITGYFGCTPDGRTSSFGRNGSDYSAAVIAYGLKARSIHIWKDVDGFMTADPKIIPSSTRIKSLSYHEAAELSYFGARVLHPRTVEPLAGTGIKVYIHNFNSPNNATTVIQAEGETKQTIIKSVTYNDSLAVLKILGAGVGFKPGIIGEIGNRMCDANINIHSIITSQTCINLLLNINDAGSSVDALRSLVGGVIESIELLTDVALIAVVGEGLLKTEGLAAAVFTAVAQQGINIEMTAAGAS